MSENIFDRGHEIVTSFAAGEHAARRNEQLRDAVVRRINAKLTGLALSELLAIDNFIESRFGGKDA